MHADDTTLSTTLKISNPDTWNCDIINNELANISSWLKVNELSLNVSKSNFMVFHHAQKKINFPMIRINDAIVKHVDSFMNISHGKTT